MGRVVKEISDAEFTVLAAEAEQHKAREGDARDPGGALFLLATLLGITWILTVVVGAYLLLGETRLFALTPVEAGGLGAAALLPALMVWIAGATAREGARARAEARRLADAANQLLAPAPGAEAATRRLAVAVRGEIAALDRALEQTLTRLKEVEGQIAKQSSAVDHMAQQARNGAEHMISGMERERGELLRISQELTNQANAIGQSIGRHTQAIAQAARQAEVEVRAADEALDARLSSFGAAAALITDRTQAITGAAQASADSALKLEGALANALDVLAKATHLTDAARESAQAATLAANATASSINNTTSRAVEDARRAADMIRGEAVAVEQQAHSALERLRDAANQARSAAHDVRGAVAAAPAERAAPAASAQPAMFGRSPAEPTPPRRPPSPASPFGEAGPPRPAERPAARAPERAPPPAGAWTWRDLLSSMDEGESDEPAPRRAEPRARPREPMAPERELDARPIRRAPEPDARGEDAIARLQRAVTEPQIANHPIPAAAAIERAGVRLNESFSRGALDRIAQRARSGTQARRRAVRDAAPDAVNAVADFLDRDANARQEAAAFLKADGARIAELLARGRATMTADATRIFLLIDAAAG